MLAYHNDPALKAEVLTQIRTSVAAGLRHSAVRILTKDRDQGALQYPGKWGIPAVLADLEAGYSSALPPKLLKEWPLQFMDAIPVGKDLSLVWPRFAVWLLTDPQSGVIAVAREDRVRAAIQRVGELYGRRIAGQEPTRDDWQDAIATLTQLAEQTASAVRAQRGTAAADADRINALTEQANLVRVAANAVEIWDGGPADLVPRAAIAAAVGLPPGAWRGLARRHCQRRREPGRSVQKADRDLAGGLRATGREHLLSGCAATLARKRTRVSRLGDIRCWAGLQPARNV